jgi:hypothetical protein
MSWRWRKWLTKVWNNIRLVLSLNEYITVSYTSQYIQVCKRKIKEKYISIIMNKISINHNEENQSVFVENESGLLWGSLPCLCFPLVLRCISWCLAVALLVWSVIGWMSWNVALLIFCFIVCNKDWSYWLDATSFSCMGLINLQP